MPESNFWENGCSILSSATNIKSHYQLLSQCRFTCDGNSYCRHYLLSQNIMDYPLVFTLAAPSFIALEASNSHEILLCCWECILTPALIGWNSYRCSILYLYHIPTVHIVAISLAYEHRHVPIRTFIAPCGIARHSTLVENSRDFHSTLALAARNRDRCTSHRNHVHRIFISALTVLKQ